MFTPHLDALRHSLEALAQPPEFQHRLLDAWSENVEELPERFVQAERWVIASGAHEFTRDQCEALAALHAQFQSLSGPANAEHWSDAALDVSPEWVAIRRLAAHGLDAFGWRPEEPPLDLAAYGEDFDESSPEEFAS